MATSEAQKKASMKYIKENLEEVRFRVPKGKRDEISKYAEAQGKSLRAYMLELISKDSGIEF